MAGMEQQGVAAGGSASRRSPKVLVTEDAAGDGPAQKPLSLPSVYYINMDAETEMRARIERESLTLTLTLTLTLALALNPAPNPNPKPTPNPNARRPSRPS